MPCNFHLRALAAQVKEGIREAGGTPMELNTIAISDGITMGTAGMKASLVSREVIADSIELVARGHMFDAVIAHQRLRQDDPRHRDGARAARRPEPDALRRLDPAGPLPAATTSRSRTSSRRSARTPPARMTDEELAELEAVASPGAGACGGQFTANTMAMALRDARDLADRRLADVPAAGRRTRPRSRARAGRARRWTCCAAASARATIITRDGLENAIAAVAAQRRLDQRRAAPARDRPRGRRRARDRRLRHDQRAHAAAVRPQARRALRRGRPVRGRRRRRCSRSGSRRPACCTRTRRPSPARRSARSRDARSETPGPGGGPAAGEPDQADRRPRDPARQPRARGLRGQARRPRAPPATAARRACSSPRRTRWPRSRTARSSAGDVVVIRNEGPAGGPGMREMLARHRGARRRRASARTSRCSPTAASPAPRTA